ncbi:ABC transporter permease [Gaopeijia maritima]|uniref:ABC transporter permease n=1 Tax=Gaopeijia maritima TaxID=3119007 RepID=A0ABU9ECK0_9BACT
MKSFKLAVRSLLRTPFVTGVAVLSLALGIGANAAIYSLMDALLLRSLPVSQPERLVNIAVPGPNPGSQSCGAAGGCDEVLSYPMLHDLIDLETPSVAGVAGHVPFGVNLAYDGRTTSGVGSQVTGSYFPVLGVRPALGRLFGPEDDTEIGGHFVAVLGHDYWQNELGGDPGVLNRSIVINGTSLTVVGVADAGFRGTVLGATPDVYVPMTMRGTLQTWFDGWEDRRWYWAYAFARLAPGATMEQAEQEMSAYYNGIIREIEAPLQGSMTEATMEQFRNKQIVLAEGFRGQSNTHGEVETPLRLLMGITALVLIIACANIANLLLARGAARSTEIAVRGSLGATRGDLLRQLMLESLVLATASGAAGLAFGWVTIQMLTRFIPPEVLQGLSVGLNPSVLGFTAVVAIGTGLLFGLYPALHATRTDLATLIRAGSGKDSGARSASRFRSALVTAQIALSVALLVSAGLFARSLVNVSSVDLGQDTEQVVQFTIAPSLNGYSNEESRALFDQAEEQIAAIAGVTGVATSMVPVLAGSSWGNDVSVEGYAWEPGVEANSRYNAVGPGFFSMMGIPLVAGREFTRADALDNAPVAVINETFARTFGLDPRTAVGKRMARGTGTDVELDIEIVGVVADAKYSDVKDEVPPVFNLARLQEEGMVELNYYVRVGTDTELVIPEIRNRMAALDPNLPLEDLRMLDDQIRETVVLDRFIGSLSASFAILATLLAAVGLYGVLSFTVARRTREIGIRMALGAGGGSVRGLVLRQVLVMTVGGVAVGLVAAWFLAGLAESLLYGVEGTDPVVFGLTPLLIAGVAFVAGYLPARRASRVDPMVALRYE